MQEFLDLFQAAVERHRQSEEAVKGGQPGHEQHLRSPFPREAKHARNLAKRFRENEAYCRFVTTPCIDPTSGLAERAVRFVVIDRRVAPRERSQKTDSDVANEEF